MSVIIMEHGHAHCLIGAGKSIVFPLKWECVLFQMSVCIHTAVAVEEDSMSLRKRWRRRHRGGSWIMKRRTQRMKSTEE